ncbi:MAG TPA: DNA mismatch repair endonuclease MutL [Terriglobia bacterium]|nr:DNA mismatch repair endonuclease MutL [Terriglobia bacterium]
MSIIHILPEAVANKIAAGEVVERPASVVKELLENSLDAGAQRVEINLEAGGKRLVRVVDDGSGMSKDDSLLAFERHATSKIRSAEDLFEVSTLGFRGEALPSIAAVSRLALDTRHASEAAGTHLEIAGGKLRDVKEQAWVGGTRIEVRDLFFNTPARRKFLKSESTELGHIATLVTHYALAHPEKSFRLTSLVNEILNVSPVATSRERIYQVMGAQLLEQLVDIAPLERRVPPVAPTGGPDEPEEEPAVVRASGFVSRPEVQKLNRNNIYFFVNRRLVRDRLILHAITQAYRNILPGNVFPVALIFLDIPASQVDVNVHPSKTEVRFRNSSFIHDFVRDAIRQGLIAAQPVAAFPLPKGAAASKRDEDEAEIQEKLSDEPPKMLTAEMPIPANFDSPSAVWAQFHLSAPRPQPTTGNLPLSEAAVDLYDFPGSETPLAELPQAPAAGTGPSEFPADLTPLGQVQESFIVATNASGLWIIDQHVAHERVLFEHHLRMRREKRVEGQRLLMPIVVELKPEQQATFQDIAAEMGDNGFEVEPFGQRTVAIKTAPADIRADDVDRLLLEILDGVGREAREISLESLRLKIAASVSCHAAVKINMSLDRNKMQWLLRELAKTDCPMTCPHGRPIVLRYGLREIQKAFKRI